LLRRAQPIATNFVGEWPASNGGTQVRVRQGPRPQFPAGLSFQEDRMEVIAGVQLAPLVALIAGVLILIVPRLLNFIVAIYLIVVGVLGLFPQLAG
jgi:hypothetical protein